MLSRKLALKNLKLTRRYVRQRKRRRLSRTELQWKLRN
jgi:hypothetical protein